MVISLIISLQVLTSCVSKPEKVYIYITPNIPFPKFPDPYCVVPLAEDGTVVRDTETEIVDIQLPYWYWMKIVEYKLGVDDVEAALEACHPP